MGREVTCRAVRGRRGRVIVYDRVIAVCRVDGRAIGDLLREARLELVLLEEHLGALEGARELLQAEGGGVGIGVSGDGRHERGSIAQTRDTARGAPAHQRVVTSLRAWGLRVDQAFFLGGVEKTKVLERYRPHIFFDDQLAHAKPASRVLPAVHVPFGVANL